MAIDFRLFGGVAATRDGEPVALGPVLPRTVLAVLLLNPNTAISLDELTARVWGDAAPSKARSSLHGYFTRLRGVLGDDGPIVRRGPGYAVAVDPETVDVHRFRAAIRRARAADEPAEALRHFDDALRLWPAEPLAGLHSPWLDDVRTALLAERDAALVDRTDRQLQLGQHASVVTELSVRAGQHPLDERIAAQYMLALQRTGRPAEALRHFHKVKAVLAKELGVGPGPRLRAHYEAILCEDEAPEPRQLPTAPQSFTARHKELAALSDMGTVAVIVGPGGIGKTWLALHWAHSHADLFPDGQLYVNLRGFADGLSPYAAMRTFLLALNVSPQAIPDDPAAMTGLYRSVLADKRLLVVIDNARDAEQVVPLLPPGPAAYALVTSRNRLTSLVANQHASLITLDVLADGDAHALLVSRLGPQRAAAEPAAVDQLVAACGGLPLALSITVGLAQEHPDLGLAALATELRDAGSLDVGVRAVLSTSFAALAPAHAELFGLLGLAPGPDIDLGGVAALLGQSYADTRTALRALERASLIQQHRPGRFRMHDLVHGYAREQAPPAMRTAALRRLADFFLHTAFAAARLLQPDKLQVALPPANCTPIPLRDLSEAVAWFDLEIQNLSATQGLARELGWHDVVWRLAWAMSAHHGRFGLLRAEITSWRAGLAAALAVGDPNWLSLSHRFLAYAHTRVGGHDQALRHARASLALAERTGNGPGRIFTLIALAETHWRMGNTGLAVESATAAFDLVPGQPLAHRAKIANDLAWYLAQDGQHDKAREMIEVTSRLEQGHPQAPLWRADLLDTLGYICRQTGELDQAAAHFEEALSLYTPGTFQVVDVLRNLGETYRDLGRLDDARCRLREALGLYEAQHRLLDVRRTRLLLADIDGL